MTDAEREELKRLAEKATPGPWRFELLTLRDEGHVRADSQNLYVGWDGEMRGDDVRFIAAANPAAVLDLLREHEEDQGVIRVWRGRCERAEKERDALKAEVESLRGKIPTCDHKSGAVFGCDACVARGRTRFAEFPLQVTRDGKTKPGPLSVPWAVAEKAWATYSQLYGCEQSVERLAERGGFGWCEMDRYFPGWREATDAWLRLESENERLRASVHTLQRALENALTPSSNRDDTREG